jgi:phage terminase large subunit-like protein
LPDKYRYTLLKNALTELAKLDESMVMLVRPSHEMALVPALTDKFVRHKIVWGEHNEPMQWMTHNSKTMISAAGNITYGKIEPKSRKTDTFKAFVAAEIASECLDTVDMDLSDEDIDAICKEKEFKNENKIF